MEMFRNLIGEIGVFMICAQAVIHFRPKEAYGKYLRLLLGVMVMVQIFAPVYEGIFGRTGENLTENIMGYKKELEETMEEAAQNNAITDLQLEETSLEMLREIWEENSLEKESLEKEGKTEEIEAGEGENIGTAEDKKAEDDKRVKEVEIGIAPVKVTE